MAVLKLLIDDEVVFRQTITDDEKEKWRQAGIKSWVTRRHNQEKEKQREAGRKSWETRRRNMALSK